MPAVKTVASLARFRKLGGWCVTGVELSAGWRVVCLLCSEDKPYHCQRRRVTEYLRRRRGDIDIAHLG